MQRRADDSDDDDGFKVSNSGRMKGRMPDFLPTIATDSALVSVLYQSNRADATIGATPSLLGGFSVDDASPSQMRKRVIRELAKRERRPRPQPTLPPLPKSMDQRRRCEDHMAASMKLRLDNSSPALSVARRQHILDGARADYHEKQQKPRTKGWRVEHFGGDEALRGPPNGRRSCPPTIGVGAEREGGVPVDERFAERPWDDPAMLKRAAEIDAAARKAKREARQRSQTEAQEEQRAVKAKLKAPVNDATAEAELRVARGYDFARFRQHPN